jgi:hypothetical protein
MFLLPPAPDKCQQCAVDHDPANPHNQESLFWKCWFYGQHGRRPTWTDAMAHCSDETKELWLEVLKENGIIVEVEEIECQ